MTEPSKILIKGAREHNLKNITLEIPKKKLVVFTGVSGSGKSSLAFDILYAEGQRRYVESLSSYARQFLGQMPKPHFEYIRGLSPAISIEQKAASKNPRSTVGTVTEIYDYLRVLYANIGKQHCTQCKKPVTRQTPQEIVTQVLREFSGKITVYAPLVQNRKGEFRDIFEGLKLDGFSRVRVNGQDHSLSETLPQLNKKQKHNIEVLIDRFTLEEASKSRLTEAVEAGLKHGNDSVRVETTENKQQIKDFSRKFACIDCGISYKELSPQSFSFNSPLGMCEQCNGIGYRMEIDPDLVIPDKNKSIKEGAIAIWSDSVVDGEGWDGAVISSLLSHYEIDLNTPWKSLPESQKKIVLHGTSGDKIRVNFRSKHKKNEWNFTSSFSGIIDKLEKKYRETQSERARVWYAQFMQEKTCTSCAGTRLKEAPKLVYIQGKGILDVCEMTTAKAFDFFSKSTLTGNDKIIAEEVLKEVKNRLKFLMDVGLEYLTLNRRAPSLSGGESQRIRLASQIGSELSGVMYILDEPSIGLHQRDNQRLIASLEHLRDLGNSVIVIEHDEETIRRADHLVDFGPGAGVKGGRIVASGSLNQVIKSKESITGKYLSGVSSIGIPNARRKGEGRKISLIKPRMNNLKIPRVDIPLNKLVAITGVSGAGKSTLVNAILIPVLMNHFNKTPVSSEIFDSVNGLEFLDKLIVVDQSPIGRSSRSNPATYTKCYDLIRQLYSELPESKLRAYTPGRFSFNVKGGRCESCQGDGNILVEMHFLPDVYVECEFCKGKRFNDVTLEVFFKGKNIADILALSILEAQALFENQPKIKQILQTLIDVGMDYVHLGQPSTTLSGGEAQRIKLSRELCKTQTGKTLYVLDEPTTGLHFEDINKLMRVLNRLVDSGSTVIVIEHNLDVIKTADHVIDLGPEGGEGGGRIVAEGTPEEVTKVKASYTGRFLKEILFQ